MDFSECSYKALHYAEDLAMQFNSELNVIHIMPTFPYFNTPYYLDENEMKDILDRAENPVKDELKRICEDEIDNEVNSTWDLVRKDMPISKVIKEYVNEKKIDLIVISTHGCKGLKHAFYGSTAERIIRESPCPVLTIR